MQFKTKMIILFLAILYANTLIMSLLFYRYSSQDTIDNYKKSSDGVLTQINAYLNDQFEDITAKIGALNNNLAFVIPMKNFLYNSINIDPILAGEVANSITQMQMGDESIHSIYIYTQKGIFDNYIFPRNHQVNFKETEMYKYFINNPNQRIGWLYAMPNSVLIDNQIVIPIIYKQKVEKRDIITVVNLSQQYLMNYLKDTKGFFEDIFITDEQGNDVVNFRPEYQEIIEKIEKRDCVEKINSVKINYKNKAYMITHGNMGKSGYHIYAINAVENLTKNLLKVRRVIFIELSILLIVSCLILIYLTKAITKPLEQLAQTMNDNLTMRFDRPFIYPYNDEIGTLAKSYNHMIRRLDELVKQLNEKIDELQKEKETVSQIQTQKRQAEFKALQAQINPHFLYNTLNTITWQAEDINANEISILSNALGKFFRISLSKGREIISIREEIEHIRSYLTIQKIRYTTRLEYILHIPEEIQDYYTIKLILQPLVENAICHGIKEKDRVVTINIEGIVMENEFGKQIQLTVSDNGVGIEKEKLKELNECLKKGKIDSESGYGIYNVNERLRLYYGHTYGLRLESEVGKGTKAIIVLPVNRKDKEI